MPMLVTLTSSGQRIMGTANVFILTLGVADLLMAELDSSGVCVAFGHFFVRVHRSGAKI